MTCPLCGATRFTAFGNRPDAVCSGCGAMERHRRLVREQDELLQEGGGRWALECGPLNERVYGGYLRERGWNYASIDRWRTGNPADPRVVSFVDLEADLTDLSAFADAAFDVFITQHVIEEIEDYARALSEIARVLRPGATALMEIPFRPGRATRRADANPYGNVWDFGNDIVDRVGDAIGPTDVVPLREGGYHGRLLVSTRSAR